MGSRRGCWASPGGDGDAQGLFERFGLEAMLEGGVGDEVQVGDRAADAVQPPVDEDADRRRPSRHDGFERESVELFAHVPTSLRHQG
jgi:hypothetical protein